MKEQVHHEFELSDKVMYGDLLRFYTPNEDWEPVDIATIHILKMKREQNKK